MEGRQEGRMSTDDIAGGAGGQPPPEGEHPTRGQDPGAQQQAAPAQQGAPGGEAGTPGGVPGAGGESWQPQSPSEPHGQPGGGQYGGGQPGGQPSASGAPPAQGEVGQADRTEGGAPGGAGGAAVHDAPGGGHDPHGAGAQAGDARQGQGGPAVAERTEGGGAESALLAHNDASEFERRWQDVQVGFVDEPQRCVQEADGLVAEVMQKLADGFARERKDLEAQWASGGEASTEDLRVALQRYRSFFNRLLETS